MVERAVFRNISGIVAKLLDVSILFVTAYCRESSYEMYHAY
jgi:hypothetical protein